MVGFFGRENKKIGQKKNPGPIFSLLNYPQKM
jgi:hypothetical protein